MDKNLISINIIAHNAESTLQKTLESILLQKDVSVEIIFIDDCSTDSTLRIIESFKNSNPRISYTIISNELNLGIAKSRNIALKHSKGQFIAIIDSDDVWVDPYKLKKQIDFLSQNSEYTLIGTQSNLINTKGEIIRTTKYKTTDSEIRNKMLILNQFCHSSILMRNLKCEYNESIFIWEDYDLILKLGSSYKLANLDSVMVDYLYSPKKYGFWKRIKLTRTEIEIIKKYKDIYPHFWIGYLKGIIKYILILLHIK